MSDEREEISDDDLRESIKRIDENMQYLAVSTEAYLKLYKWHFSILCAILGLLIVNFSFA